MDVFYLQAVVNQLQPWLQGARINKVQQPSSDRLLLQLYSHKQRWQLLLVTEGGRQGLYAWPHKELQPAQPPRFCQLLRSRCHGVLDIWQQPGERVVILTLRGGQGDSCYLVLEAFGRRGNLLLLDSQEQIIDSLHRQEGQKPGQAYTPPALPDGIPLAQAWEQLPADIQDRQGLLDWLRQQVRPISPTVLAYLRQLPAAYSPSQALQLFLQRWHSRDWRPVEATLPQGKQVLSVWGDELQNVDVLALAQQWLEKQDGAVLGSKELQQALQRGRKRLQRRREQLQQEDAKSRQDQWLQRQAELLLAHVHALPQRTDKAQVYDYYEDPPLLRELELDSRLTVVANAQRLFHQARKARRAGLVLPRQWQRLEAEEQWLADLAWELEQAQDPEDLRSLHETLAHAGLLARQRAVPKPARPRLYRSTTPGGYTMLWGGNSRSNELLLRQHAQPSDLWFHLRDGPGCHLVLKTAKTQVSPEDQEYAAAVAAGYSKASADSAAEVIVTSCSQVHRPKGGAPGQVWLRHYQSLRVKPRRLDAQREAI